MDNRPFWTTRDIADKFGVHIKTAALWCEQGRFAGAFRVNIRSGPQRKMAWLIPAAAIEGFEKPGAPGVGRPRKEAS